MSWRQTTAAGEGAASRAINVDVSEAPLREICTKHKLDISAIEPLASGGTRVVMRTIEDADRIRSLYKRQVLDGTVERVRWISNSQ